MKLQEKTPFSISEVFAQSWTGGVSGSGSGINVQFTVQQLNTKEIQLQDFFFRGKQTSIEDISTNNNGLHIARYLQPATQEMTLHKDTQKEAGNEPPKLNEKIPFTLKPNEAVISYLEKGTLKYYKIENIVEKFPNFFPSAPQKRQ